MKRIFDDDHRCVTIDWSRPSLLDSAPKETRKDELLYLISAACGGRDHKLLYVGQAYASEIRSRLRNSDHKRKQAAWAAEHPRHQLYVRYGSITSSTKTIKDKQLDDIEKILIYCVDNDYWKNKKGVMKSKLSCYYDITNSGNRAGLPKRIGYGLFASG